jgi:isoleucyl-tRNA synthetase
MDFAREVCSAAHSIRKARGLRSRLPLARLTVAAPGASELGELAGIIADELNVREVCFLDSTAEVATTVLTVVPGQLGPRLGERTQLVIGAVKRGEWREVDGAVVAAGETLEPDEYALRLRPIDDAAGRALPGDRGVVVLELTLTDELEAEGAARDLIRAVQQGRKDFGLHVADRIEIELRAAGATTEALDAWPKWRDEAAAQTLATSLSIEDLDEGLPSGAEWFTGSATLGALGEVAFALRKRPDPRD